MKTAQDARIVIAKSEAMKQSMQRLRRSSRRMDCVASLAMMPKGASTTTNL
jgi:hypothetical protein